MICSWTILSILADGEVITSAKYHIKATDEIDIVETEGNWTFDKFTCNTPLSKVTEAMVVDWIKEGATVHGKNVIESRLEEQLASMKAKSVAPPWKPPVFTLE
jgi:hypothetical protein